MEEEESPSHAHLDLPGANVKLLQDVDEEVLNLHPGVDAVGTVQDNDDVHVSLAPWGVRTWSQRPQEPVSENLWFPEWLSKEARSGSCLQAEHLFGPHERGARDFLMLLHGSELAV